MEQMLTESKLITERRKAVTDLSSDLFDLVNNSFLLTGDLNVTTGHEVDLNVPTNYKPRLFSEVSKDIEYVYHADFEGDVSDEFEKITPVQIATAGSDLIEKVVRINEKRLRNGQDEIFKPTTKTIHASIRLPNTLVSSEDEFNVVLDSLFFMIYEASGGASSRITKVISNTDSRLDVLWRLKHLRLGARHDLDHGDSKAAQEKFKNVGNAYIALVGKVMPETPNEWRQAQLKLYIQLRSMLGEIHNSL